MRKIYSAVAVEKRHFFFELSKFFSRDTGTGGAGKSSPHLRSSTFNMVMLFLALIPSVILNAQVTVTPGTGGTGISADLAANATSPGYTILGNILIQEVADGDIGTGVTQVVLNAPAGWTFNTSGVTATVTGGDFTTGTITYSATAITIPLAVSTITNIDLLTISNVAVRAVVGATLPAAGNITPTFTGTINNLTTTSNLGSLSQVAGDAAQLVFTTQPANTTYGTVIGTSIIETQDQFGTPSATGLGATVNVTASIATGTGTLTGTTIVNIGTAGGNGTASFLNLFASAAGSKTISITAPGLTTGTSASVTVNQAVLNITATGIDKVYDGNTTATVTLADDRETGDVLTIAYTAASFANANVGTGKAVTVTGITVTGADAGNYTFNNTAATTADITAKVLTITATGIDKVYDGNTTATVTLTDDRETGDVLTIAYTTASFANANVGTGKAVSVTGITVTGADAGNYTFNNTAATTADITAKVLTITATGIDKVYDGNTTATVTLGDDRETGDVLTIAYTTATFANANVGTGKAVSVTGITVTGADAGNYTFNNTAATTADITVKVLTITATGIDKVYDGNTTATVTLADDRETGDVLTIAYTAASFANANVGTGKAVSVTGITVTGADAGNYTFNNTAATTADITAKVLTITATGIDKVYDGNTTATVTLTDDRETGDVLTIAYTTASFANANVGTGKAVSVTGITVTGTDAGNYTFNNTAATTADITAKVLTITATGINKVYDGNTSATVTLGDDRETGDILTIAYTTATFANANVGTGKAVSVTGITVTGADAGNYTFNNTAATTADITAKDLTITATGIDKVYDGSTTATVTLADDRVTGDVLVIAYTTASFANANVGIGKAVSVTGITVTGADASNYTFNNTSATTADITAKVLTITATGIDKVYDGNTTATVTLADDRETGDVLTIAYTTASFANANVGTGKAVSVTGITVTGADAGNYTFSNTAATTADITAKVLTITADNRTKAYGATLAMGTTAFTSIGLITGETIGGITLASAGAINTANAGTYPVVASAATGGTFTASNYTITYADGTLTVGLATLTVTASAQSKVYGTTVATAGVLNTTFTATGLLNGDAVSGSTLGYSGAPAGNLATAAVGSYTITPSAVVFSTGSASNYTIVYTTGTLTVTTATLTVAATVQSKVYGGTVATAGVLNTTFTATGLLNGNAVSGATLGYSGVPAGNLATASVGSYTITPSAVVFSSGSASNYTIVYTTGTLTVTPATLTVTATAQSKVYGGTVSTAGVLNTTFTAAPLLNGNTVSGATLGYSGAPAGNLAGAAVGSYVITPSAVVFSSGSASNYSINYVNGTLTVTKAVPAIALASSLNPACLGAPVTFTATLTPASAPVTGTIQFRDGATPLGTVTIAGNVATFSTSTLTAATHNITAVYSGDANYNTVTSSVLAQLVNALPAATGITICQGGTGSLTSTAPCAVSTSGTVGANFASAGLSGGGAGTAWTNPVNGTTNNNAHATVSGTGTAFSEALNISTFGFNFPAGAVISGIQVSIGRFRSGGFSGEIQDNSVRLLKGGVAVGNNYGATNTNWSTSETAANYGGAGDLWGTTWSVAEITAANFGVALIVDNTSGSFARQANVDYISVTVTYTIPGTLQWYTVSSGGTAIGNNSPFNPVGVTGSGLPNTNTPGTYTFYAACAATPDCRTAVDFVINPLPTITGNSGPICVGGTLPLTGSATPAVTNPWVSATTSVATVTLGGVVTGVGAGTSVITYTNSNGCQQTTTITVLQPAITGTLTVCQSSTTQLSAAGTPAAVNPWVSSNPAAATISNSGLVSGVAGGSTIITYTNSIGCTATATVTVNADATIVLTSATSTTSQTPCINTAITPITYLIGGGGTGATVTGLPAGVTGVYNAGSKVYTISGTPTAAGTFNYTVTSSGPCIRPALTGSITVRANSTLALSSGAGSNNRTTCINVALINITFTIGGGATGAGVTGLPSGISGNLAGNVFTISGTPTASGSFPYTVTATGPCLPASLSGTITVNADATITLTSAVATTAQTWCVGTAIPINITYQIGGGGTGATLAGQPAGVSGSYNTTTKIYTISGTPTASGTFNYTVTTTGPCIKPALSGTMTVTANPTLVRSSAAGTDDQEVCTNTPIVNITYLVGATGTGATVTALPAGVTSSYNAGTKIFTISGTPTVTGSFNYTVTTTGPCANPSRTGTISTLAAPIGTLIATEMSGISNNDNEICTGATVTFTATPGFGSYTFRVNGVIVQNASIDNDFNSSTLTNGASVTVDVANALNCGSTFGPIVIVVNPLPTPTLAADKNNICAGDTVIFTASGGTNYAFMVNNSVVQSSGSTTYETSELLDNDVVTVEVTNANGCIDTSASMIMNVNALPAASITPGAAEICAGTEITFTAAPVTGLSNFEFFVDGVSVQGPGTSSSYTATFSMPSILTLVAENVAGCSAILDTVLINVNAVPSGSLSATENSGAANDNSICAGIPVTFTASTGFSNYEFKVGATTVQSGPSSIFTSSTLADGNVVTVEVSTGELCTAVFNPITITVVPSPAGTLVVSPGATVCEGATALFTATPTAGNNYRFILNGTTTLQNGTGNTFSSTTLLTGSTISVEVTNANSCITVFNPINLTVSPAPTTTLVAVENSGIANNDDIICSGDSIVFTAPAGFTNYNFLRNGISVQNGASRTYTNYAIADGQQFAVAITNEPGCIGLSNTLNITVHPLPPVLAAISGAASLCINEQVTYSHGTTGGVWSSLDDGIASVDLAGIVTGVSAGTTSIVYTVSNVNGCLRSVSQVVTVNPLPAVASITGVLNVCVGSTRLLANATTGGTWNSSDEDIATVSGAGLVTGITSGPVTISYAVTNANNCTTTVSVNFTVNDLPVLTPITVVGPATSFDVCVGGTITVTSSPSGGAWSISGPFNTAAVNSSGVVTGLGGGTATINYRVINAAGCTTIITHDIVVHDLPVPTLTGPNPICPGATAVYITEDGFSNYTWNITGGVIVGPNDDNTVTVDWNASGPFSIFVNYENGAGCTGATSATVTANTGTTPTITGPASICRNSTATYTTQGSQTNYIWTVSGGDILSGAGTESITINWHTAGSGSVSINFTDVPGGCTAANPTVLPIAVNALPVVVTHDQAICAPNTADLTIPDVTTGSSALLNFEYFTDELATTTVADPASVPNGTYYIVGTNANGCKDTAAVEVIINTAPTAGISYASSPYCTTSPTGFVTHTGATGGIYSAPSGLTINSGTGAITPTSSTAGTYTVTYTIAPAGGCVEYTTTASVSITAAPSATIAYSGGPFCTSAGAITVTRTGTAGGTYSSSPAGLSIDASTGTITPSTSTGGTYTVTYQIDAAGGCALFTTQTSITITTAPAASISYPGSPLCTNAAATLSPLTGTPGGTFTVAPAGLSINTGTGIVTPASSTPGSYVVTYSIAGTGGCANFSTTAPVVITAAPTAVAGTPVITCAGAGPINITAGSSATNNGGIVWTSDGTGTFTDATSLTSAVYTPSAADITAGTRILTLSATGNAGCASAVSTKAITINAVPPAFIITPPSASICLGDVQSLTATGSTSTSDSKTASSGTISISIPDANFIGPTGRATSTLSISGIPTGAVIDSVKVRFNVNHTATGDIVINLQAPDNTVLNLVNQKGGGGNNFVNTTISSNTVAPIAGTNPYGSIYAADAVNNVGSPNSNVPAFGSLTGTPNGDWKLHIEDNVWLRSFATNTGTLTFWTITINYTIPNTPLPVIWTPATGLYTNPGATIAYAGQGLSTVYAKPTATGNINYFATATNGANCTTTQSVEISVAPKPAVTISADYCIVPGKVRLTANSVPIATNYIWSNGSTTQFIDVDVSGIYEVTAIGATSCPGRSSINVANELVVNGDFEAGNIGFISEYVYEADVAGNEELRPEGTYGVGTSGQNYHEDFYGRDHTTAAQVGNFMLVNGSTALIGTPGRQRIIWEQTVPVLPNTNYYFSAYGMNLNPGSPARLRFEVNGVQVGTIADLNVAPKPTSNGAVNINNWVRFYSNPTWLSGPTTTSAVIRIVNLNTTGGGNDFGLDDISFGTLSTFVTLQSAPGTDAQTLCKNTPITNIVYNVGNGSPGGPTVAGLPPGVTEVFSGDVLNISGTPTVAGTFTYTVTTTGCNPVTASGTITVQAPTIVLSAGSTITPVCKGVAATAKTYTIGGTATGANVIGLPAGMTGSLTGNIFTISGTPTSPALDYNYTITTTGGSCAQDSIKGTIRVQEQLIVHNSGSTTPTLCINTALPTNIRYTVSGTGTGASVSGLPGGLVGTYNSGIFIISGTPTASGIFNYTVTTSGPSCSAATATGTITVTPAAVLALTSAGGTNAQNACNNLAITDITYSITNATNASITSGALPTGVTGVYNSGVFTISGTPTVGGLFNYTITTTGGCGTATASGTITVQSQTITLTSGQANPALCAGAPMTNIVYTIAGTANGATVTGLPTGVTGSLSGSLFTLSGSPTAAAGLYPFTIITSGTSCDGDTARGTITVQPAANPGTIVGTSTCSGTSGSLTVTGHSGTIVRWESSINGGTTWTPIANTTITQGYTNIMVPTLYQVVINNNCGDVFSTPAMVSLSNYWTGATDTDWNDPTNWSDGVVPSTTCANVTIPAVTNLPVLASGTSTITNLIIQPGATVTVNGTGILQIGGTITSTGGFDLTDGSVVFNGTTTQTISSTMFTNDTIKNLTLSNAADLTINNTSGNVLYVSGTIGFGSVSNAVINTGDNMVLTSTATGTARVGQTINGNGFNGLVTVERYFPARRSWRLFTGPVYNGGSVFNNWQIGGVLATVAPGRGTYVTGPTAPADGLDVSPLNNSSLKVGAALTEVLNTNTTLLSTPALTSAANIGYFIFVRGDRRPANFGTSTSNTTTLSSRGRLQTGPQLFTASATANGFTLIGNPYASPVDFGNLTRTNIAKRLWVWDPYLNSEQGGYILLDDTDNDGTYSFAPPSPGGLNHILQSGQAFFVQTATAGPASLEFNESDKSNTASNLTAFKPTTTTQSLRVNLYNGNTTKPVLLDGVLAEFNENFNKQVDNLDAVKLGNVKEMLALVRDGRSLFLERRPSITADDTLYLRLTKTTPRSYRFELEPVSLDPLLSAFLEDSYTKAATPLNLSSKTVHEFSINGDAASAVANRFRIVFKQETPVTLPVMYTSITANKKANFIAVDWKVENEQDVTQYEVEKSTDGVNYVKANTTIAAGLNTPTILYNWLDENPVKGKNYYRVRSISKDGKAVYSKMVVVNITYGAGGIRIYPNPVTTGIIGVEFKNMEGGIYKTRLLNELGQTILSKLINHAPGTSLENIRPDYKLTSGIYHLEVTAPDNQISLIKVIVK